MQNVDTRQLGNAAMNLAARSARWFFLQVVGTDRIEKAITGFAGLLNTDLVRIAYQGIGILNYENQVLSGERFFYSRLLSCLINSKSPVFFDVGANNGEVSVELSRTFPHAEIWSFEPNPVTFRALVEKPKSGNIKCQRVGMGSKVGKAVLHCYLNDQQSGHATMYPDVFELYQNYGIKGADKLTKFEFPIATIDSVCEQNSIREISFLKIDVEGHELEVLKGAHRILSYGGVGVIQFEVTDCNVVSRVFLKDFYDLLPGYKFFRLNTFGLVPLGTYMARHEIFQFQNIVALRNDLVNNIKETFRE